MNNTATLTGSFTYGSVAISVLIAAPAGLECPSSLAQCRRLKSDARNLDLGTA